ncbi:MAG: hypothetical protein QXE01_01800 [Sulfolobales archaeon]
MARKVHYLDLLGLAINGLLRSVKMESCSDAGSKIQKSKIIGVTRDNELIETECIEYHRIVRTWIIIKHYDRWGKYMVTEDKVIAPDIDTQEDPKEH